MARKLKVVRAPKTTATPEQVQKQIANDEKMERRQMVAPRFKRSHNRGSGEHKNYNPDREAWWNIRSMRIHQGINAEGNLGSIPVISGIAERDEIQHKLTPDERKIRRMKNKQRKLGRIRRGAKQHGRAN